MLSIGFALRNPWSQRYQPFLNKDVAVSSNKTVEVCLSKNSCIIEFGFGITGFKQDHAGLNFDIGLLGYHFDFMFYDNRHYHERTNPTI